MFVCGEIDRIGGLCSAFLRSLMRNDRKVKIFIYAVSKKIYNIASLNTCSITPYGTSIQASMQVDCDTPIAIDLHV